MPAAGKTGTTQNWSDAWTVGFTPYYTTAIWFGFDRPGNSLGLSLTGATLSGPVWGDFMREIHMDLPAKDFIRPTTGIIDVTVCAKSGLLKTSACNEGEITLPFLEGTQPTQYCTLHGNTSFPVEIAIESMRSDTLSLDESILLDGLRMPSLPADFLTEPAGRNTGRPSTGSRTTAAANRTVGTGASNAGIRIADSAAFPDISAEPGLSGEENSPNVPDALPPVENALPVVSDEPGGVGEALIPPGYGPELPAYNPLLD
jgi:penicillin-binding protein 1A